MPNGRGRGRGYSRGGFAPWGFGGLGYAGYGGYGYPYLWGGRGNPYPFCRNFPWLPRWWWATPYASQYGATIPSAGAYPFGQPYGSPYGAGYAVGQPYPWTYPAPYAAGGQPLAPSQG